MTSPEDLDELLQVNSARIWLLFSALSMVIVGILVWGFFGTITQEVKGFGIIKTHELPRKVVAIRAGHRLIRFSAKQAMWFAEIKG